MKLYFDVSFQGVGFFPNYLELRRTHSQTLSNLTHHITLGKLLIHLELQFSWWEYELNSGKWWKPNVVMQLSFFVLCYFVFLQKSKFPLFFQVGIWKMHLRAATPSEGPDVQIKRFQVPASSPDVHLTSSASVFCWSCYSAAISMSHPEDHSLQGSWSLSHR